MIAGMAMQAEHSTALAPTHSAPAEPYPRLFWRFLRFGLMAWGGPVAQIAMIRQELVEEERWVSPERFNRVLAVYQVLPGPEAHELCVYFGMLARGRPGGVLAGLGFMLPGFGLMFGLSWLYVTLGINMPLMAAVFMGFQPAVAALIVRGVHRIGGHVLQNDRWLWGIALGAAVAELLGVHFAASLLAGGAIFALARSGRRRLAAVLALAAIGWLVYAGLRFTLAPEAAPPAEADALRLPSLPALFFAGLRTGLLTFGGAYTAIPFLQRDAVEIGGWMTNAQFLDGLALSGILPAPLIIFSTFVGYLGGGPAGALVLTAGVFAPAFGFTLLGHRYLERLVDIREAHAFLDGVTAGVVGLISATTLTLLNASVNNLPAWLIFGLAVITLFRWKARWAVPAVLLGAGALGLVLYGR
jgi:chromate transporter